MAIFNDTYQNVITILVHFLRDQSGFCPSKRNLIIEEQLLLEVATRNKLQHILFHFLTCDRCRLHVSKPWLRKIRTIHTMSICHSLVLEKEKELLDTILKKHFVQGILFKQREKNVRQYVTGSDLDILIPRVSVKNIVDEYVQMGYKEKHKGAHKEVQLVNVTLGFEIDLHFLLAYPHYSELSKNEYALVQMFSEDLFKNIHKKKHRLAELSLEWYFLASTIRYWQNDLMTGLRDLKRIVELAQLPETLLFWDTIVHLAVKYNMKNELFFMLSVGSNIFKEPLPKKIQSAIPWWIRMMAASISVNDIALFPPIMKWNWKKYRVRANDIYTQYDFIKRILKSNMGLYRLAHPRDFYYFNWHIIVGFMHIFSKKVGLIYES